MVFNSLHLQIEIVCISCKLQSCLNGIGIYENRKYMLIWEKKCFHYSLVSPFCFLISCFFRIYRSSDVHIVVFFRPIYSGVKFKFVEMLCENISFSIVYKGHIIRTCYVIECSKITWLAHVTTCSYTWREP